MRRFTVKDFEMRTQELKVSFYTKLSFPTCNTCFESAAQRTKSAQKTHHFSESVLKCDCDRMKWLKKKSNEGSI